MYEFQSRIKHIVRTISRWTEHARLITARPGQARPGHWNCSDPTDFRKLTASSLSPKRCAPPSIGAISIENCQSCWPDEITSSPSFDRTHRGPIIFDFNADPWNWVPRNFAAALFTLLRADTHGDMWFETDSERYSTDT